MLECRAVLMNFEELKNHEMLDVPFQSGREMNCYQNKNITN